jgi:hypothetical protein
MKTILTPENAARNYLFIAGDGEYDSFIQP